MWIRRDQVILGVSEHRHRQAGLRFRLNNLPEMARLSERCVRASALQTNPGATGAREKSKLNNMEHGARGVWFASNTPLHIASSYLNHSFYGTPAHFRQSHRQYGVASFGFRGNSPPVLTGTRKAPKHPENEREMLRRRAHVHSAQRPLLLAWCACLRVYVRRGRQEKQS